MPEYTIGYILNKSSGRTLAEKCTVEFKTYSKEKNVFIFRVLGNEPYSERKGNLVGLWFDPEEKKVPVKDRHFKAHCSCDGWLFNGSEYHAEKGDYLLKLKSGRRGNGKAPSEKDPENKNLVCKHVYASLFYINNSILKRQSDVKPT